MENVEAECVYIVTVQQEFGDEGRALARNEIENLLRDHVQKHPHFENYGEIEITVDEG